METKKSPKVDLENKKGLFLEIGIALSLLVVFGAFEWSTRDAQLSLLTDLPTSVDIDIEMVPITKDSRDVTPPPPPAPKAMDLIEIVDDGAELDDVIEFDSEGAEDKVVDYTVIEAQVEDVDDTDEPIIFAEVMPEFEGGQAALMKFLAENVKYPAPAQEMGIQGRVFVSFVVDKTGEVTDVKVVRPFDPNLDREAVRVVKLMPRWSPGMQRGKPVKVAYTVPISFRLEN